MNHSKYVVSVPDEDELKCWIAAVRPYSVMTDADVAAVESAAAELSDMVTDADGKRQDEDELENSGQSPSAQELHQAHSHDQTLLDVVDAEQMMHVQPSTLSGKCHGVAMLQFGPRGRSGWPTPPR